MTDEPALETRNQTGPTQQTLKRLFALSSNRCAFPKCPVPIIQNESVIGRACHIKAANPSGARHDPSQKTFERHAYENLILLCPNHHAVVDDDEQAYTVDRLTKMKFDHERLATQIDEAQSEAAGRALLTQSVSSVNQFGGITAHTVNFNLGSQPSPPSVSPKTKEAVEIVWRAMLALGKEFSDLWVAETIMETGEINECFKKGEWIALQSINSYRSPDAVMHKMRSAGVLDIDAQRLYVPDDLWNLFYAHRALYGRLGVLYTKSFQAHEYINWRTDNLFETNARLLLSEEEFARMKGTPFYGLQIIFSSLENEFRRRASLLL